MTWDWTITKHRLSELAFASSYHPHPHLGVFHRRGKGPSAGTQGQACGRGTGPVGTGTDSIVKTATRLLEDEKYHESMSHAGNPYGDGKAAWSIANILEGVLTDRGIDEAERKDDRYYFMPALQHLND